MTQVPDPAPTPDRRGWFEPVLGRQPTGWPPALPHLYALNVARDPAVEVSGGSFSPDGSHEWQHRANPDRSRVERIGYWDGQYRVVGVEIVPDLAQGEAYGRATFDGGGVRYLMHAGQVVGERPEVAITGRWPTRWEMQTMSDLIVLCTYLEEQLLLTGGPEVAAAFRNPVGISAHATEQIAAFEQSLRHAAVSLARWLSPEALEGISRGLAMIQRWRDGGWPG